MASLAIAVRCANCKREVPEQAGGPVSARKPCEACGSLDRRMAFRATDSVRARLAPNDLHEQDDPGARADETPTPEPRGRPTGLRRIVVPWGRASSDGSST
jgi:hypothetical protein